MPITSVGSLTGWRKGGFEDGVELMGRAAGVVVRFNELMSSRGVALHNFPCFAASRCLLNSEAVMWLNRVKSHIALRESKRYLSGLFEDVAIDPENRTGAPRLEHGYSTLSTLAPVIDECDLLPVFLDDEPAIFALCPEESANPEALLPFANSASAFTRQQVPVPEKVRLTTFTQVRAVPGSQSRDKFPLLVRVRAPVCTQQTRAPIDVVMALDISATMRSVLHQLKQGAEFAILNLREDDRLSIVTFGPRADKLSKLTYMNEEEKRTAIAAVASLKAKGGVGIGTGLKNAYEVLKNRSEPDRVGCIILLTDGKDTPILKESQAHVLRKSFEESDKDIAVRRQFPTYTFGFGTEHDPRTLYYLACEGYGTYSFANESSRNIEDAMALCIGGLTSIVAQNVVVTVKAAHPEVKISEIRRGLHEDGLISDNLATIHIKDLFGDEEKNFIVYVNIPKEEGHSSSMASVMKILTVTAEYSNPMIKDNDKKIRVDEAAVHVERPKKMRAPDSHMSNCSPEVEIEMYRIDVLDRVSRIWNNIAAARNHSPYFNKEGAKRWDIRGLNKDWVLDQLEKLLSDVDPTVNKSADPEMAALRRKLYNDLTKMKNGLPKYVVTALPYMLSWLSSQRRQRAATQVVASESSFLTVRMQNMIASVKTALANSRVEDL